MLVFMDVRFLSLKLAHCLHSYSPKAVCCSDGLFNHGKADTEI